LQHKMIVILAVALLCITAWAISADGDGAAPTRAVRVPGDIPAGYQPPSAPAPTQGEPPQLIEMTDGGAPVEPKPLWGPDATVYSGNIKWLTDQKSERMIAYDQTEDGILFAAFTVPNGDTAHIYRSTDGGNNWALWNGIRHAGNVLTSLELVVAEGDSSFVFFFVKSSAGNGDIYVGRWNLASTTADIFNVKVDSDTIANLSACRDLENPYYLYVTYETRAANYNMYQLRSTTYGRTWSEPPGSVIVNTQTSPKPDICYGRNGHVYAVCRDLRQSSVDSVSFRLKHSTNRGDTWLASEQVGTPAVPVADPVVGAKHNRNTVWLVHSRDLGGANGWSIFGYTSTDSGSTWQLGGIASADADEQMPSIACNLGTGSPTLCYTVAPGESVMFTWCSMDTNWTEPEKVNDHQGTGFFPAQAGWNSNYSSVLYAGYTALGLYFDAFSLTGMEEGRPVAEKPAALVARPSPAFDRAVISYNLPFAGPARVSVLDVVGREVAVLARGTFAAGAQSTAWNCEKVPAGVYLIRVDTRTGSQTGRLVVSH
jgi:hypothetical protein